MLKMTTKDGDLQDISKVMTEFNMQMDKQGIINEQISDMMGDEDEMEDDTEIDSIIEQEQQALASNSNGMIMQNPNQNTVLFL